MPETRCTSASRFKLRRSERIQPTAQAVGSKAAPLNEPRRGERQKLGRARLQSCRATVSEAEDQTSKLTHFSNSPLHFFPSICYKQFTESRCVAAGRSLFESLVSARHLYFKRVKISQSSRPRD